MLIIALVFGVILGLVHFWNEKLFFQKESSKDTAMSFVAGVSVAYVFLFLLPDLYEGIGHLSRWIFVFVLVGFGLVHLSEKYLRQHASGQERLFRYKEIHFFVLFSYYLLAGLISVYILKESWLDGILFYIPVLFYAAVGRVSFSQVYTHVQEQRFFRWLLALSSIAGVLMAPLIATQFIFYHALLAFVIGAFLYIVLIDFIPDRDKGKSFYFLMGASIYTLLIALVWIVG